MGVLTTFLLALASAALPVVNMEVALVAADAASTAPDWLLAAAAAVGQVAGKTLYYLLGAGVISPSRLLGGDRGRRRPARPVGPRRALWAVRLAAVQAWAQQRPWGPAALTFVSAVTGLPPFAVTSFAAGTLRVPLWLFWATGLSGRFLRFLAVVGVGGRLTEWLLA